MSLPTTAYPGLPLSALSAPSSGPGTYISSSGSIHASLAGALHLSAPSSSSKAPQIVSITSHPSTKVSSRNVTSRNVLPSVGDTVLARVTRLEKDRARLSIMVVGDKVCADGFVGVVRREDIRGWEIDKVIVGSAFRVGDTVRAVVVCLASLHVLSSIGEQDSVGDSVCGNCFWKLEDYTDFSCRTRSRWAIRPLII